MIAARITDATRIIGKSQGYGGLPIRDEQVQCSVNGPVPAMTTAWEPTPDEIAWIVAGAMIEITILGTAHPPMIVGVGEQWRENMSEQQGRMPEEISLPFVGRVSLTAVVVHFACKDMRLRGVADDGTEIRLDIRNGLEGGTLPGVPCDIPVGTWKLYDPKSALEPRTEAVMEVSLETYNEIKTKLLDAGYGHLVFDGYVSMSGLGIAPPAESEEVESAHA